jgi:phytoene dehydrogenase-like protein
MSGNFYDAILLGRSLPTVIAGALLAKRGFRVLLLSQAIPSPSYSLGDLTLPRAPFQLTARDSPVISRVLSELALKPLLRRRTQPLDRSFQVVMPGHRMDFGQAPETIAREVDREFPAIRRATDDFYRASSEAWRELDSLIGKDLIWPPTGFLERREFSRAAIHHPFGSGRVNAHPLGDLPLDHPFRHMVSAVMRMSDGSLLGEGNPRRQLRLFNAWLRAAELREGGYSGLLELLEESIRVHSGHVRDASAEQILVKRGSVTGVRLATSGEELGAHFVLVGTSTEQLLRICPERAPLAAFLEEHGSPRPRLFRYTLNLVVRADAIPEGTGDQIALIGDPRAPLRGANLLRLQLSPPDSLGRRLICTELLLPAVEANQDKQAWVALREQVVTALEALAPFIRPHILWMDSPHDGLDFHDVQADIHTAPPDPWTRGPQTMEAVYTFSRTRLHGSCALPARTPVKRLLLCNSQVVPGLGLEGSFLTAWSAARLTTRTLGKAWLRKGRWTRLNL